LGRPSGGDPLADYSVDLGSGQRAKAVFAGTYGTCVITDRGQVKCWGQNLHGQLGLGDTVARGDGTSAMGDGLPFVDLGEGQKAASLAVGEGAACAVLESGRIKCWGDAYQGALGYGDNVDRGGTPGTLGDNLPTVDLGSRAGIPLTVKEMAPVDYHSFCAILADTGPDNSALKCWGSNNYCELGAGTSQAGFADVPDTTGDNLPWVDLGTTKDGAKRKAIALAGSFQSMCALGDDGAVKCWGDNLAGQLGIGFTGAPRSCLPNEVDNEGFVNLPSPAVAVGARGASSGGGAHACALLQSGMVSCWGENAAGQLGTGDTEDRLAPSSPLAFAEGFVPAKLVLGGWHSCAISTDERIQCWGRNTDGQLGSPPAADRPAPGPDLVFRTAPVRSIAAGDDHTCAILDSGAVKCWGRNGEGQLGVGDTTNRGDEPDQMGDDLAAVDLGPGLTAIAVAAGSSHTCVVSSAGEVKCWGANDAGQLGIGGDVPLVAPALPVGLAERASSVAAGAGFSCALLASGAVQCWGKNDAAQLGVGDHENHLVPSKTAVSLASRAVAVAAADDHACALLADHRVECWGANVGPAVVDLGRDGAQAISARAGETCVLLLDGHVKCWGDNARGQLGLGDAMNRAAPAASAINLGTAVTATAIAVGGDFACALLDSGRAKCWGDNASSELGTSLNGPLYGDKPGQMGDALPVAFQGGGRDVIAVSAGRRHVCAILDTRDVRCWGDNTYGQLGVGDSAAHSFYAAPTATVDLGNH
jgi:alpha-tubulin suppressor-like RCC1 family protein